MNRYGHYHTGTKAAAPAYDYRAHRRSSGGAVLPAAPAPGPVGAADQGFTIQTNAGGFPGAQLVAPGGGFGYALDQPTTFAPGDDYNPLNVGNSPYDLNLDPWSQPAPTYGGTGGAAQGSGDTSGSFGTPTAATTNAGGAPAAPWHYRRALKTYAANALAAVNGVAGAVAGALGADPATTGIRYRAKRIAPGWAGFSTNKKMILIGTAGVGVVLLIAFRKRLLSGK